MSIQTILWTNICIQKFIDRMIIDINQSNKMRQKQSLLVTKYLRAAQNCFYSVSYSIPVIISSVQLIDINLRQMKGSICYISSP